MRVRYRLGIAAVSVVAGIVSTWAALRTARQIDEPQPRLAAAVGQPTPAKGKPLLWLLAIGVSRYADIRLNLSFAEQDARAVAEALSEQGDGRLYGDTRVRVLANEEVTRESVLTTMESFLGQAGPDDVAAIFIAGHGVLDRSTGSYYFLPYPATVTNLVTAGLRVSDFDEMVRIIRRNVRGVVLMLDTCHAGALGAVEGGTFAAEEVAGRMSVGEGFFLLAATKPGEESREWPALGHGAFTYALVEGVRGAGDTDQNGLLTVSDLFGYVARRVPELTNGAQHPYHKMEGTDLVFAAVATFGTPGAERPPVVVALPTSKVPASQPEQNAIGVVEFDNLRDEEQYEWIGKALRIAFNTELSKVHALRVYSPEVIDRTAQVRSADDLETAQRLGIDKLVTGAFQVVGSTLRVDAHIVDVASGVQQGSDSVEGELGTFFDLQKRLVISMLQRLPVPFSREEDESIRRETNTDVNAYRLLLESEGVVGDSGTPAARPSAPRATPPTLEPQSYDGTEGRGLRTEVASAPPRFTQSVLGPQSWWWGVAGMLAPAAAFAAEPTLEAGVRALLEEYRTALEAKQLDQLASLYVTFSARQRAALHAYLENATTLNVEVTEIVVGVQGNERSVSFTRRDRFTDRESGKPVRLEVRLTKTVVHEGGRWKLAR